MSRCSDSAQCPGGNCLGCVNGRLNCIDPRCYPNCEGCPKPSNLNWALIVILVLLGVLLILAIIVGVGWYNQSKQIQEYEIMILEQPVVAPTKKATVSAKKVAPVKKAIPAASKTAATKTPKLPPMPISPAFVPSYVVPGQGIRYLPISEL